MGNPASLPTDIVDLLRRDKFLEKPPIWDEKADKRYYFFVAPLSFGNVSPGGFELRVKISKTHIERDAMVQLEYAPAGRRSAVELWRIDWRPFSPHTNEGNCGRFSFQTIAGTHHHPFCDNYMSSENRMRGGGSLPSARQVRRDPKALQSLLAFSGKMFKIRNMSLINLPSMSGDLFWTPDD